MLRLALRVATVLVAATAVAAPGALAAPASRDAALAALSAVMADQQVPAGWTGSTDTCTVGTESAASIAATARTVNTLRDFAGLPPVAFEPGRNGKALAAALMMKAKNDLSHSPDPAWPCYSADGAKGANTSNLFLGLSGAEAMVGYVDDGGVASLGHRFWLLDPAATLFGTGSTGTTNALLVVGSQPTNPRANVAWPPPTWVPSEWVFRDWSVEFADARTDVSGAQVSVTVGGAPVAVSGVRSPGGRARLSWTAAFDPSTVAADTKVDVAITGTTAGGAPAPLAYSFTVLPASAGAGPPVTPVPVPTAVPVPTPLPTPTPPPITPTPTTTGGGSSTTTTTTTTGGVTTTTVTTITDGVVTSRTTTTTTTPGPTPPGPTPKLSPTPSPGPPGGGGTGGTKAGKKGCKPPKVVGQTLSVARKRIAKAGCKVGTITRPRFVRKGSILVVRKQAGKGPTIRLTVSRKR